MLDIYLLIKNSDELHIISAHFPSHRCNKCWRGDGLLNEYVSLVIKDAVAVQPWSKKGNNWKFNKIKYTNAPTALTSIFVTCCEKLVCWSCHQVKQIYRICIKIKYAHKLLQTDQSAHLGGLNM